jgi:creatinine amidohydrolase
VSLHGYGLRKFDLINGHGGNEFMPLIRQLQCDLPMHVFQCNSRTVGHDRYTEIFGQPDDHAGGMETSVALVLHPQLVELEAAGAGAAPPCRFEAFQRGWVRTSRSFARLNDHFAVGDPRRAAA